VVLRVSMDGQKSFLCIMAGQEARTKAMKIAVSVPGNNIYIYIYIYQHVVYIYIVFIKEIEIIRIIYYSDPFAGVEAASLKGQDKDQIEVKGEGIDTVKLATLIRKKVGHADIVSVAEEKKEDKKEDKKDGEAVQVVWPYTSGVPNYQYPIYHEMNQEHPGNPSCSIM
jgi:hypothetical protein